MWCDVADVFMDAFLDKRDEPVCSFLLLYCKEGAGQPEV
jgi:hypothetical protein